LRRSKDYVKVFPRHNTSGTHTIVAASGPFYVSAVTATTLSISGTSDAALESSAALNISGGAAQQAGTETLVAPHLYVTKVDNGTTVTQNDVPIFSAEVTAAASYIDVAAHPAGAHASVCYRPNGADEDTFVRIVDGTSDGSELKVLAGDNLSATGGWGYGCSMAWDGTASASDNGSLWLAKAASGANTEGDVHVFKSTDNGSTFSSVGVINLATALSSNEHGNELAIDLALNSDGNPIIAARANDKIEVWGYTGSTFEKISRTGLPTSETGTPVSIAVNGNVYAVSYFTSLGAPKTDIFYDQ